MIKVKPDPKRPAVTIALLEAVTKPRDVTIARKGGRPKVHATDAERQRAYRRRKAGKRVEIGGGE